MQHINLVETPGWTDIENFDDLQEKFNFPSLPVQKFDQLAEISHGSHCIQKGMSTILIFYLKSAFSLCFLIL